MCILKCQVKSIIIHEHLQVCQRVIHDLGCARTPLDQRQMVLSQQSAHNKQIQIQNSTTSNTNTKQHHLAISRAASARFTADLCLDLSALEIIT